MKKSISSTIASISSTNVDLNKKSLRFMASLNEVMRLLKIDSKPKGK